MELFQTKLNKREWESIEIPVSSDEKKILTFIKRGFHNVSEKHNDTLSLLSYTKISNNISNNSYLYVNYLEPIIMKIHKKNGLNYIKKKKMNINIKKADAIRLNNNKNIICEIQEKIYEFIILKYYDKMISEFESKKKYWCANYIIIFNLLNLSVLNQNNILITFIKKQLDIYREKLVFKNCLKYSKRYIEDDPIIQNNGDIELYPHQKELFTLCKNPNPKLILYIASTGTGKTVSPIGLSEKYKIIFVCAARHVGLALAKSAISVEKKVAFAFGCNDANDIRLHYFAAKDFIKNRKTGGIFRVDNSIGDDVEIMICDIKSYIPAMLYMKAFNDVKDIITYWDEPTISLDYPRHELHELIKKNWTENQIPNMVLSSATLPKEDEIKNTIIDFQSRYENSIVKSIVSHDFRKSIPFINKEGYKELPHYMFEKYKDLKKCASYCIDNKTILRNLDLQEIIEFIIYINDKKYIRKDRYLFDNYFQTVDDFNIRYIKEYYLVLLKNIKKDKWLEIYSHFKKERKLFHKSNIYITTKDAHSLTNGPTIFLSNNVLKIAKFCIQISNIPDSILTDIIDNINFNNIINKKTDVLEKEYEDITRKDENKEKKMANEDRMSPESKRIMQQIKDLQSNIKNIKLHDLFVPNSDQHLKKYNYVTKNKMNIPFTSDIKEDVVESIMQLHNVEDYYKLLLLMGIGVFHEDNNKSYTEIMKSLAVQQKLYVILASSDYIYGTNYQFCHGYIGKDLSDITQEKCIQAIGRIGRNKSQQLYSIRFRDNNLIKNLLTKQERKIEVINMNKLFSCLN